MNEQDNKDSIIASYELTASHKEEDSISEHEMDDMIRESEDENHTALPSQSQTRKISHFVCSHFLWLIICVVIFVLCIFLSNLCFKLQDRKTLNSVGEYSINQISLEETSNMTILEKINIINGDCYYTDLNFDYTDKHSYGEIHDLAVKELDAFFTECLDIPITVDGIYEMYINKYMISSDTPNQSFTGWVININYFGFQLNFVMDYDTAKILSMTFVLDPEKNSYYSVDTLMELPYYNSYIAPLDGFMSRGNAENENQNKRIADSYLKILKQYYGDDVVDRLAYGASSISESDTKSEYSENASASSDSDDSYNQTYTFSYTDENDTSYMMMIRTSRYVFQINRYFYD